MKTRKEIIDIVVETFKGGLDTRAISKNDECLYQTECGKKCAVGIFLKDNAVGKYCGTARHFRLVGSCAFTDILVLDEHLIEEVRGHPLDFWTDLQTFHDFEEHFTLTGYTNQGKEKIKKLHEYWDEK